tara:strand:+ start:284 stop:1552 length:1269 start_codon:yes stop_codon:yes gene_type:complete
MSAFQLADLPEWDLFPIVNNFLTLKEISRLMEAAASSKSTPLHEKCKKILSNLTPRYADLTTVGLLRFLVENRVPVGALRFRASCWEAAIEHSYTILIQNLRTLLPNLVGIEVKVQFETEAFLNRYVNDSILEAIAMTKNLWHLDLRHCPDITDHGVMLLSHLSPQLRHVDISKTHYPGEENEELTHSSIIALSFGCTKLETIVFDEMDFVGDDTAMMSLSLRCQFLKRIGAFFCDRIGDKSVCSLGRHCHMLEDLDITYSDISDKAVLALADGCPLLKDLSIAFCDTVTDASIVYIADKCLQLEKLNLRGLLHLTDKGISALCSSLIKLRSLVLSDCPGLRDGSIASLCRPALIHLELPSHMHTFSEDGMIKLAHSQPTLIVFTAHRYLTKDDTLTHCFALSCPLLKSSPFQEARDALDIE